MIWEIKGNIDKKTTRRQLLNVCRTADRLSAYFLLLTWLWFLYLFGFFRSTVAFNSFHGFTVFVLFLWFNWKNPFTVDQGKVFNQSSLDLTLTMVTTKALRNHPGWDFTFLPSFVTCSSNWSFNFAELECSTKGKLNFLIILKTLKWHLYRFVCTSVKKALKRERMKWKNRCDISFQNPFRLNAFSFIRKCNLKRALISIKHSICWK